MRRMLVLVLAAVLLSGCGGEKKKTEPETTEVIVETVEDIYAFAGGEIK